MTGAIGLLDVDGWTALVARVAPDAIVHLGAAGVAPGDRDPGLLFETNALWPATLVRAAAASGVQSMVVAGSSAEYAPSVTRVALVEDSALETIRLYGATKAAGNILATSLGTSVGVNVAVLRLFNVYGAGEAPHRLIPSIVVAAREERPIRLSAGTQVRDFIAVQDACAAIAAALDAQGRRALPTGAYNVSTGIGTSVADFARVVARAVGADPSSMHFGALPMRPDELPWLVGDARRFMTATGWRPSLSLDAGVAQAVDAALPVEWRS